MIFRKGNVLVFILAGLALVFAAGMGYFYLQSQKVQQTSVPSVSPTPTPSQETVVKIATSGQVEWNPKAEEVLETPALALTKPVVSSSRALDKTKLVGVKYYKVGTWLVGQYKGRGIIDEVVTVSSQGMLNSNVNSNYIVRATDLGDSLLVYEKSSSANIVSFHDDATHQLPKNIILDSNPLPDLLTEKETSITGSDGSFKGNIPFSVQYQGKTKSFTFEPTAVSSDFAPEIKSGYKFFTTFPKGQRLYGKDQGTTISC